ncbi:hypothetical protein C8R47DRAFT_1072683 [Mycena vitilis]|nr:hypothetical protein C8R47DRAFT_1072683 [Mycena vitilis]
MRRRYTTSDQQLRLRSPMPQLAIGGLALGGSAIVPNGASPQEVAPQNDAPQQPQSVPTAPALSFATTSVPDRAISPPSSTSVDTGSTTASRPTAASQSTSAQIASVTADSSVLQVSSSPAVSSLAALTSTIALPLASPSSSLSSPARLALTSSAFSSESTSPASSLLAPSSSFTPPPSSSSLSSPSSSDAPSATSASALGPHKEMTHMAPIYAAIILGALIVIACLATILACLVRSRARRRDVAALSAIGWDPVVLDDPKQPTAPIFSFTGDRDVGEPKRAGSLMSRRDSYRLAFDTTYQHPNPFADPDPFVETAYYSPHQVPPLADSSAYPLPPARPPLTIPRPRSNTGPYPTVRPLPAHLADRDPHRVSYGPGLSAASSRSGSVRSHLPSATTLCVTNGSSSPGSSRASTALGIHADGPPQHTAYLDFGAPLAQSVRELGTPREREARPRFMSLGSGRGLDVPWRRESFAVRGGGAPGWATLQETPHEHEEQGQGEGWTQTLRASVLGAFQAFTAVAPVRDEAREGDDGLTRAPSTARERREAGWRRFADEEQGRVQRGVSVSSRSSRSSVGAARLHIPEGNIGHLQPHPHPHLGISMASSPTTSVRTDSSRAPLISRPRPAALVSRTSSVYSTVSVAHPGYDYRSRGG